MFSSSWMWEQREEEAFPLSTTFKSEVAEAPAWGKEP